MRREHGHDSGGMEAMRAALTPDLRRFLFDLRIVLESIIKDERTIEAGLWRGPMLPRWAGMIDELLGNPIGPFGMSEVDAAAEEELEASRKEIAKRDFRPTIQEVLEVVRGLTLDRADYSVIEAALLARWPHADIG